MFRDYEAVWSKDLVRQKEPMTDLIPNSKTYLELLERVKRQIRTAQMGAALAVNQQLVLLYWGIGKEILQRQANEGWGAKSLTDWRGTCARSFQR
jgi:hypothetical protein